MKKTMIALVLCLLVSALAVQVQALEQTGSIRIHMNVGELPVTNGAFTLYRVGTPTSDGYRIGEEYGGGFVRESDALSPHLVQWMSQTQGTEGKTLLMDVDGNVVFSPLEEGLYLVKQTELTDGFYPIQPFLMSVPCQDRYAITVNADPLPRVAASPPTGQSAAPAAGVLGMMVSTVGMLLCIHGTWKKQKRVR